MPIHNLLNTFNSFSTLLCNCSVVRQSYERSDVTTPIQEGAEKIHSTASAVGSYTITQTGDMLCKLEAMTEDVAMCAS